MLFIRNQGLSSAADRHWHVGDPMPKVVGKVVTFQADGHELEMILAAMKVATVCGDGKVRLEEVY